MNVYKNFFKLFFLQTNQRFIHKMKKKILFKKRLSKIQKIKDYKDGACIPKNI